MTLRTRPPFWPGLTVCTALLTACSLTVDAGQVQCHTDTDCTSRGGEFAGTRCVSTVCAAAGPAADAGRDATRDGAKDSASDAKHEAAGESGADGAAKGPYACVGHNPLPVPTKSSVTFTIVFTDFLSNAPVTAISVSACPSATDPSCVAPSQVLIPNAQGSVAFTLNTSQGAFAGYFKIDPMTPDGGTPDAGSSEAGGHADASSPDAGDASAVEGGTPLNPNAYIPSRIYYSDAPIATDSADSWSLITGGTETILTNVLKLPAVDPKLGLVLASVVDCHANLAAGVSASLADVTASTEGFYVESGVVSATATETDLSGIAGFVDVPTGAFTLTTKLVSTGQTIGSLTGYVLPGTITYGNVGPTFTGN